MLSPAAVSRLASLSNDLSGTTNDLSATFAYNPASQITSTTRTGDAYAWTGHINQNWNATSNGLNQLTAYGAKSLSHDAKGNVTAYGTRSFTFSSENLLLTAPGSTTLAYDPAMRLYQVSAGTTARFAYDGLDRIAEHDGGNTLLRRYVHGPGVDEPLVWYEGSGTSDRRFLSADERGSIIAVTDSAGNLLGLNRYDEFGQPQATNLGTWGYTGQAWLPGANLWHYKARVYEPELGRFLQPDPIGVEGGVNLYTYVGNDPVDLTDPLGLVPPKPQGPTCRPGEDPVATGCNPRELPPIEVRRLRDLFEPHIRAGGAWFLREMYEFLRRTGFPFELNPPRRLGPHRYVIKVDTECPANTTFNIQHSHG